MSTILRKTALIFTLVAISWQISAAPIVPSKATVAGMHLVITKEAQAKIQKYVDEYQGRKIDFDQKAESARAYFPLIEKKLKEGGVPTDLKYIIIMESGFVADAANPKYGVVGFWQFKDVSAVENGMAVNDQVDERMNISRSTLGAAKLMKTNYPDFGNWMYALLSFQLGRGGAKKYADPSYFNKDNMEINTDTPPFIIKFLAHYFAYSEVTSEAPTGKLIDEYPVSGKSLQQVATETNIPYEDLKEYNKWLKSDQIPADKEYLVTVPTNVLAVEDKKSPEPPKPAPPMKPEPPKKQYSDFTMIAGGSKAKVTTPDGGGFSLDLVPSNTAEVAYLQREPHVYVFKNGLKAIEAKAGDTKDEIGLAIGLDREGFAKINDLDLYHVMQEGKIYYLEEKKKESPQGIHTVAKGETLWEISQEYGLQMEWLMKYNGISDPQFIRQGQGIRLKK